jgi:hypothetical protein
MFRITARRRRSNHLIPKPCTLPVRNPAMFDARIQLSARKCFNEKQASATQDTIVERFGTQRHAIHASPSATSHRARG